ncbi:MAG: PilZ domain-containing protein [Thauera propionica]|jgi:hypothetical protein|uniref:PilZ domain-containing protein n=1 Tax=Thauera propionica TaxID=2019431 RepID=A0A235F1M6_9RHOO|nr:MULTISPECIES: PilZ domain-containing protein [Thauera]MDD3674049.1 PilZ domain-containing protein [Thauera propionica]MDI3491861.1 hypothetical protein [Thauera sp.]MDY0046626.1 PilZ domain-containing protein [Thauera propionica]OYD55199.1 PilZ domain-containing protein [Thauera propionica]
MSDTRPEQTPLAEALGGDRRGSQRFVARRRGEPCFWVVIGGERIALNDISPEGFSFQADDPQAFCEELDFVLLRDSVPDEIRGRARRVNYLAGSAQLGCRFVTLQGDGVERLRDWLIAHVIMSATVRITEKDAAAIVNGPSLI